MRSIFIFFATCLVMSPMSQAASATQATTRPSTQPVAIPYRLTDTNHILIRVKINGQGPFNFIMDTGAPAMFIRVPVGKKLGLKPTTRGSATLDTLEVEGGAKLTHVPCVVQTPFQIEGMNAIGASGVDLDGLLGYEILARFRLQIDLSQDCMLWTPLDFVPPPLVSGRRRAGAQQEEVDRKEEQLEATGGLLKLLGPLIKPNAVAPKYRGLLGIELAEKDKTVSILRVLGNSPAEKAGLMPGDRLITVNNQTAKTIAETQIATLNVRSGQSVPVVIQRDLAQLTFKIISAEGL